jgi:predicted enzyme related to lactoylglutathione lyase
MAWRCPLSLAPGNVRRMTAAAVLYVRDLARMRAFYEQCFALTPAEPGDGYCVLASADWDLSLVAVPPAAAAIVIADPPERRAATPVKLAFEVASIEALRAAVTAAGGRLDPAGHAWEFRGRRHLDCLDPEGNVVQLRQRA